LLLEISKKISKFKYPEHYKNKMNVKSIKRKHEPLNDTACIQVEDTLEAKSGIEFIENGNLPKIFITEEKMAMALEGLNIGTAKLTDKVTNQRLYNDALMEESAEFDHKHSSKITKYDREPCKCDENEKNNENGIVFSDELKINLSQNDETFNIKNFYLNASPNTSENQLQIIAWTPSIVDRLLSEKNAEDCAINNERQIEENSTYKVEEPQTELDNKINQAKSLKRKFSYIRKIPIEELRNVDHNKFKDTDNNSTYYVETNDDENEPGFSKISETDRIYKNRSGFITEVSKDKGDNEEAMTF
jgi:hypothetical protein